MHGIKAKRQRIFICISAPISLIVFINVGKAVCGIEDHSKGRASELCNCRKCGALHFNHRAAFALSVSNLFLGFAEKSVR